MDFYEISTWIIPLVLAITLHEAAHGWMALKFGDDTAFQAGRLTFNPLRHIDLFGTLLLPGLLFLAHSPILFGYAKPVPVEFGRLQPPRLGMFMVAVAGVLVNLLLAVASALLLHLEPWLSPEEAPWLYRNLYQSILINLVLIVFNLIPLLPLDGGRAVYAILPRALQRSYRRTEGFGMPLIFGLLLLTALADDYLNTNIRLIETVVGIPALWLMEWLLRLTGNGV